MSSSVLVAYSTRYGSTKEVAEAVAGAIRAAGESVDLMKMKDVKSLEGYQGVVLGAPLYMFRWHPDARRFLPRHRKALEKLPVAVFALGPFHDKEEEWQEIRRELDKELAGFPWLNPVSRAVFGGKFDPSALRLPWTLLPALKKMPASDIRDWPKIKGWAAGLTKWLAPAEAGR
jgi:menaquinone-dependent protoporphyrinogen oxidase